MKCIKCGKEYEIKFTGMISAFSPIWNYCPQCIEQMKHVPTRWEWFKWQLLLKRWNFQEYVNYYLRKIKNKIKKERNDHEKE